MKNLLYLLIILLFFGNGCGGEDGGASRYRAYYMENSSGQNVTVSWYRNGKDTTFTVIKGEEVLLYESGTPPGGPPPGGLLRIQPFSSEGHSLYDSVRMEFKDSRSFLYETQMCASTQNPLCEENYELITCVDTKKQKTKEWLFTIK